MEKSCFNGAGECSGDGVGWRFPAGEIVNCTHCGVCVAACPGKALELDEGKIPRRVRPEVCTLCGLCERVCPGREIDFVRLRQVMSGDLGGEDTAYDPWLGPVRRCMLACDAMPGAPVRSSSGGAITALLRHALRSGFADAVCSTSPDPADPTRFVARMVSEPPELEEGRQAKYQIIPSGALMREARMFSRIVFVGPGCQIAGIRKLQFHVPEFREKIALAIGFFCSTGNLDYGATEFMLRRGCGFDPGEVARVEFRYGAYPGFFRAERRSGESVSIPKDDYKWLYVLHTEPRCMACVDLSAELADISFGDPYGVDTIHEGMSAGVIRTNAGQQICLDAAHSGELSMTDIDPDRIVAGQYFQFAVTRALIPRLNRRSGRLRFSLEADVAAVKPDSALRARAAFLFMIFRLRRPMRWLFARLPFGLFAWVSRHSRRF
jgi:coenzyme F420 hydrogenase subunit beta